MSSRGLVALWIAFCAINVVAMVALEAWATIPFHFIWVSLTLLYGLQVWRPRPTALALVGVSLLTGVALTIAVKDEGLPIGELTEVPLMAAMFGAMVWHALRRQRALEEVRRLAEREREFIRSASHQLRTPITVAAGHAELLLRTLDDEDAAEDLSVILEELARLNALSDRMIALASAEEPQEALSARVEVDGLIRTLRRRWEAAAPREWRFDGGDGEAVIGDREQLESAIDAVIDNALKATRPGDRIAVRAYRDGGQTVRISVSDTGVGIEPEHIGHVFDRFWRTDAGYREPTGGTGLGLAIVRAVAQTHGGTVEARSEPGVGTTIDLTLPTTAS